MAFFYSGAAVCSNQGGVRRTWLDNISLYFKLLQVTALHCTAQHCTALHCTALHCTALHCTALLKKIN
jgi:hypothetical protein